MPTGKKRTRLSPEVLDAASKDSADKKTAIRQLRKVLRDGGIKIVRDEFNIIDRRGDRLRCVFLLDLGAPGVA